MHNLKKDNKGHVASYGAIQEECKCEEFRSFNDTICHSIRSILDLIVMCPMQMYAEERILILRYNEEIISTLKSLRTSMKTITFVKFLVIFYVYLCVIQHIPPHCLLKNWHLLRESYRQLFCADKDNYLYVAQMLSSCVIDSEYFSGTHVMTSL